MDPEKEKASVVQNVDGERHKVVGGNIIHGDAHFHIHGDTTSKKEEKNWILPALWHHHSVPHRSSS